MLKNPEWSAIFAPTGRYLQQGEIIRRTNLSLTLATIANEGASAFYKVSIFFKFKIKPRSIFLLGPYCRLYCPQGSTDWGNPDTHRSGKVQRTSKACLEGRLQGQASFYIPCTHLGSWFVLIFSPSTLILIGTSFTAHAQSN